ncbi:signal peptidase I [Oscillatoria acuminata]|uniref:Signal peptidase I n=1 Tax=Oscillatoria acuminata PCC 6304 TaxID=56110 RepID=K9TMD5_9CYAN|nr:signal peptidase I [Oscillatoria acuminata]AFY84022.1 signal peptidase I [Oscillatoria acuminata PCC 6304]
MTPAKLQAQAKQGDLRAIAALIDDCLTPHGMRSQVRLHQGLLSVSVHAPTPRHRQRCVSAIRQLLMKLRIPAVARVRILGKNRDRSVIWSEEFSLGKGTHVRTVVPGRRKPQNDGNSDTLARGLSRVTSRPSSTRRQPRRSPQTKLQKDPWLAVNLSVLFPGLGQIYAGKFFRGLGIILIEAVLIAVALATFFSPEGNTLTSLGLVFPIFGIYLVNIIDAHRCFKPLSFLRLERVLKNKRNKNNPWVAVFLSQLLPGLGHLYLKNFGLGAVLMISLIVASNIARLHPGWLLVPPLLYAIACYHAYFSCPRSALHSRDPIVMIVSLIVAFKLTTILIPAWIEHDVVQRFTIPSDSMVPTLRSGDQILALKSRTRPTQKGDLIVFRAPEFAKTLDPNAGDLFIKRTIGMPLDVLRLKDGIIYINNQPLSEDYVAGPAQYNLDPQIVPADSYFVLGDNRNNSFDSHVWGYVPRNHIIGKAYKIYWPPERIGPLR